MKNQIQTGFHLFFIFLFCGCSSLTFRQGYRLDSESKNNDVKDLCSSSGQKYIGAMVSSSEISVGINLETRIRANFLGIIPVIPFIPVGFSEDQNVSALVSTDLGSGTIQTDFHLWQISPDGINWSGPTEVNDVKVYSDEVVVPREDKTKDIPSERKGYAAQLIFQSKVINTDTVYLKSSNISFGTTHIKPFVLKWTRENYWRYSPMVGGMDGEAPSMMVCR